MVEQLQEYTNNIIIVDNCSTYVKHKEYLKTIESIVRVIYKDQNYGHRVLYRDDMQDILGDKYILTDPDLQLNPDLPKNFIEILDNLTEKYKVGRIGLALDISRDDIRTDIKFDGKSIIEVQNEFWIHKVPDDEYELYRANTDTTFSFINKKYNHAEYVGFRIAGNFTCIHKPFHIGWETELEDGELEEYIRNNISTSCVVKIKINNDYPPKKISWLRT